MTKARQFRVCLDQEFDAMAERLGFRKQFAGVYTMTLDTTEVIGKLSMPYTVSSVSSLGRTSIDPRVGVRHLEIVRIKEQLLGINDKNKASTVLQTIMHISPRPWAVYEVFVGQDNSWVLQRIEQDVENYGIPWIRRNANLESIIQNLRPKTDSPEGYWFNYLVALGIAGCTETLRKEIERQEEFVSTSVIPGYIKYGEFLSTVRKHFGV